ncbi:MAG: tyrosine--tRNA ligase, partial [Lachnospiraceae bacterium]|nr:tyrosine--tRNA ligase [Lachnospiraceae bacterium]
HYGCNMQFGGDDQWSNMLGGTELIRKKTGKDAYAMTVTLLLNSEGKKMGKTAKGALWLDPKKTTPFEFYQYWRNIDDADVMKCLKMLTFLPLEQIKEMETWEASRINEKKMVLAHELTELVHGKEEADKAEATAKALFSGEGDDANMPTTELTADQVAADGISAIDLLSACKLIPSRSEGRRLIEQGGMLVNGEKVASFDTKISAEALREGVKIKKGKKIFHKAILK